MSATPKLGIKCKLYYNTGSYGSPTWVEITKVGDAKVKYQWKSATSLTRETRVELSLKTALELGFTFTLRKDPSDANYLAVDNAAVDDTVLDLLVLDGTNATNLSRGFRFDAQITQAGEDQGPDKVVHVEFEAVPAISANVPQRAVVTAGSPVFTAL